MKRAFDVTMSLLGLIALSPVLAGLAIALLMRQGRPVFFGQLRIGQYGVPFVIWKFRTMVPNAARMGLAITARNDSRITPMGAWLRRTKLDELPQLWNVLLGDMSLVGPRPEVSRYVEIYDSAQRRVLELKPGITDLASLEFVNEEDLLAAAADRDDYYVKHCIPRKIELNLQYAKRAGVMSDMILITKTIGRLFSS